MFVPYSWNSAGEKNKNSKLKKEQVEEIRTLFKRGSTQKELAEKYSCSRRNISSIVTYSSWTDYLSLEKI